METNKLFRLKKPLYGLSESGYYWHETLFNHLIGDLCMTPATSDLILFYR